MVSSGSTNAASGTRYGLITPFFRPSVESCTMAMGDTSLPVPDVVGTHTSGTLRPCSLPMPNTSPILLLAIEQRGDQLRHIHGTAAAQADDESGARVARRREAAREVIHVRLFVDLVPDGHIDALATQSGGQRFGQLPHLWRGDDEHATGAAARQSIRHRRPDSPRRRSSCAAAAGRYCGRVSASSSGRVAVARCDKLTCYAGMHFPTAEGMDAPGGNPPGVRFRPEFVHRL